MSILSLNTFKDQVVVFFSKTRFHIICFDENAHNNLTETFMRSISLSSCITNCICWRIALQKKSFLLLKDAICGSLKHHCAAFSTLKSCFPKSFLLLTNKQWDEMSSKSLLALTPPSLTSSVFEQSLCHNHISAIFCNYAISLKSQPALKHVSLNNFYKSIT